MSRKEKKEQKQLKPLSEIKAGRTVRLARIEAGSGLNSRLASMGLTPNIEITVIRNSHPCPFIISVKGSKVMLGRGMARKIMVK